MSLTYDINNNLICSSLDSGDWLEVSVQEETKPHEEKHIEEDETKPVHKPKTFSLLTIREKLTQLLDSYKLCTKSDKKHKNKFLDGIIHFVDLNKLDDPVKYQETRLHLIKNIFILFKPTDLSRSDKIHLCKEVVRCLIECAVVDQVIYEDMLFWFQDSVQGFIQFLFNYHPGDFVNKRFFIYRN